jgi:hypothetical protein
MKNIIIISEQEYRFFTERIAELKKSPAGSKDNKELKMLTKAVMQYQRRNRPAPDCGISQVRY